MCIDKIEEVPFLKASNFLILFLFLDIAPWRRNRIWMTLKARIFGRT